jgi:hypothetical protein
MNFIKLYIDPFSHTEMVAQWWLRTPLCAHAHTTLRTRPQSALHTATWWHTISRSQSSQTPLCAHSYTPHAHTKLPDSTFRTQLRGGFAHHFVHTPAVGRKAPRQLVVAGRATS